MKKTIFSNQNNKNIFCLEIKKFLRNENEIKTRQFNEKTNTNDQLEIVHVNYGKTGVLQFQNERLQIV